jgi:hypothetical protein
VFSFQPLALWVYLLHALILSSLHLTVLANSNKSNVSSYEPKGANGMSHCTVGTGPYVFSSADVARSKPTSETHEKAPTATKSTFGVAISIGPFCLKRSA